MEVLLASFPSDAWAAPPIARCALDALLRLRAQTTAPGCRPRGAVGRCSAVRSRPPAVVALAPSPCAAVQRCPACGIGPAGRAVPKAPAG
eukprot:1267436-Alexandrium_andersonii.AAC.1